MHLSSALKAAAIAAVLGTAAHAIAAPISVTDTSDAAVLSSTLGGSGVTISSPTYTGATGSAGTFTGGAGAGLGFNSGIVLSTGFPATPVRATSVRSCPAAPRAAPRPR